MSTAEKTYVACLTPPGRAAIATLAVHGPQAWEAVRRLFQPRSASRPLPEEPKPGSIWLGKLAGDDVVVAVRSAGAIPSIELHCHGGPEVLRLLTETFATEGVEPSTWQELARRNAGPGTRYSAETELPYALTVRTAAILLDQAQGAFDRALEDARAALQKNDMHQAATIVNELVRFLPLGRHLTKPWQVAIIGAPNVGKSSLVNALAGFERCIVSPTPGTTRDAVTTLIAVDGWPVELIDTAGLHETQDALDSAGIARAQRAAQDADLCLWVLDGSTAPVWPDLPNAKLHYVVNKADLPAAWERTLAADAVVVSAQTGVGLDALVHALATRLVPERPPAGAAVPFNTHLAGSVLQMQQLLASGKTAEALALADHIWTTGSWPPAAEETGRHN